MWCSRIRYNPNQNRLVDLISCCSCSLTTSCPTLCDPTACSTPGFPVLHYLLESAQIHVHWIGDAIQLSHPLSPLSPPALNLSQYQGLFQWVGSASGGQSIGTSASVSVLPMSIQGWFPLGLTGLISLLSEGLQESSTALQFKSINSLALSLYGLTFMSTWLLEKP